MFNSESFVTYQGIPATEAIGTGVHMFEVLYAVGGQVYKVWVSANTVNDAIRFFCKRFDLIFQSKQRVTARSAYFYRIDAVSTLSRRRPYDDAIIRKVK